MKKFKGKSLPLTIKFDPVNIRKDVFTPVKGKRVKGFASVRYHSLDAGWDTFDIQDVGELIKGTRELIDQFL